MSDRYERSGGFDPFEDTGDWPFRDAPPRPEAEEAQVEPEHAEAEVAEPAPAVPEPPLEQAVEAVPEAASESVAEVAAEAALLEAAPELTEVEEPVPVEEHADVEPAAEPAEVAEEEPPGAEEAEADAAIPVEHAAGALRIPDGHEIIEGGPHGFRRTVALVVGRFNGDITNGLLESALEALEEAHVAKDAITIVPVPGAFELPLAALALAKTRRYSCVVALGAVIRGETPHFDFVASEAASGLQLAAIETGIPVSFGVLTCETREQAEARVAKGAEAARAALEMADLFSQVRTRAAGNG